MYKRRYATTPRAGYRSRYPRRNYGRGLRRPKEPSRWEVGQFYLANITNITDAGNNPNVIVTSLAQITDHFGVTNTSQGITLDNAVRFLEIGGIVFRYEIIAGASIPGAIPDNTNEFTNRVDWRVLLVSDRLDALGQPTSIPNWFNTTAPVIAAASASGEDIDDNYPTRIHWQNYHGTTWSNREGNGTGALNSQTIHVDNRRGGANLRLRLRLDDQTGLFWHFAQAHTSSDGTENVFTGQLRITGTIYYRWRF